jgi:protocatechuate 3,4-dioxygenase, beta subunit
MHPTPADPETSFAVPRRRALLTVLALGGAGLLVSRGSAVAANPDRAATPAVSLGPFYPAQKPADSDADLTIVAGRAQRASGTILYTSGRVLDLQGRPLRDAAIEVWQANAFGRYHHPGDSDASGPLDPNFQAYGRLVTDAEGHYRIKTIKPPRYAGRTPHLHFNVSSGRARLTTQMFFEGDPGNDGDFLYRNLAAADRRAATGRFADRAPGMETDAVVTTWDIVLRV